MHRDSALSEADGLRHRPARTMISIIERLGERGVVGCRAGTRDCLKHDRGATANDADLWPELERRTRRRT